MSFRKPWDTSTRSERSGAESSPPPPAPPGVSTTSILSPGPADAEPVDASEPHEAADGATGATPPGDSPEPTADAGPSAQAEPSEPSSAAPATPTAASDAGPTPAGAAEGPDHGGPAHDTPSPDGAATTPPPPPPAEASGLGAAGPQGEWSASFPFEQIEGLRTKLVEGGDGPPDTATLDLISRQAAELRASVVRLASEKLEAAEAEAASIRRAALDEVAKSRGDAAKTMVSRVEEASAAADTMRRAAVDESRHTRERAGILVGGALREVRQLREEMQALFARTEEMSRGLEDAERRLTELDAELSPASSSSPASASSAPPPPGPAPSAMPDTVASPPPEVPPAPV